MKKHEAQSGILYVTSTPIGNASDISLRALTVLAVVDFIACEDTRVTSKLLSMHGISGDLVSYHDHNADRVRPQIIQYLKDGKSVAFVSDAGTPLISDPGYKLVRSCHEAGLSVTTLPGASSVLSALILSGLPSNRFLFEGFLPAKTSARRDTLSGLVGLPATLVFMESAARLAKSLNDMVQVLGERDAAVIREITKMFEETRRGALSELAEFYNNAPKPKGEIMVVVGPPDMSRADFTQDKIDKMIVEGLATLSVRDCAREIANITGKPRQDIYKRALALGKPTARRR